MMLHICKKYNMLSIFLNVLSYEFQLVVASVSYVANVGYESG